MEKIRISELFAETWAIFKGRYRALLPILLKAILPYYLILLVMQYFNSQNLAMFSGFNQPYGGIRYGSLENMMIQNLIIMLISFIQVIYVIFVYTPATYGMNISTLYPGVDGDAGLKNAFKMYGKALGNTLFSYLPALITTIVLTFALSLLLIPVMMILVMNGTIFTNEGAMALLVGFYIVIVFALLVGISVVYAYSAQMIPLSLLENVPITQTFSLSRKRGRGAILAYASIQFLFLLLFMIIGGAAVYLLYMNHEGYFALMCVSQAASLFLLPFTFALNAAMYRLCRGRKEQATIEAATDILTRKGF